MLRDRLKRLYHLHSIVGIALGWLLFVVCFSGSTAMFFEEISSWEDPSTRGMTGSTLSPINPLIEEFHDEHNGNVDNLFLFLPHNAMPYYALSGSVETESGRQRIERRWLAATGQPGAEKSDGPAEWLLGFHQHLMIESQVGRTIVGIAGVFMLLSILTGIIVHRKILKDLYKVRWGRSRHLQWKDLHNGLGVWSLPFGITISFSGAILGIVVVLLPLLAITAFKGDQDAALAAVLGERTTASGIAADMVPLEDVIAEIDAALPYTPARVSIEHWGDDNARYRVFALTDRELVRFVEIPVSATTGIIDETSIVGGTIPDSTVGRILAALTPLHYGTYGGLTLKVLYYLLGIVTALTVVTGLLIWLERRLNGPIGTKSEGFYQRVWRMNSGITTGFVLASMLILYTDRLFPASGDARLQNTGTVFLLCWSVCIAYAITARDARASARNLMAITTLLCLGLPFLDFATAAGAVNTSASIAVNMIVFGSGLGLSIYLLGSRKSVAGRPLLGGPSRETG